MVRSDEFNALCARVDNLELLIARVEELEKLNEAKDKKIKELEGELKIRHNETNRIDWSNILKTDSKKSNEEIKIVNAITAVNKDIEKREKNIVIVGVKLSAETETNNKLEVDRKIIEEMFDTIGADKSSIKRIYRFKPKANAETSPILVELPSCADRNSILKEAKKLKLNNKFKGVYINPDQNEAERKLTSELVKERNAKNDQLDKEGKLNQPFRYGIRDYKVVQINIVKQ